MKKYESKGFLRERIIFYTARMIAEQIGKAENYDVIKQTISIIITDYRLITENENYHNRYKLYDAATHSEFGDLIEIHTLELPKLPPQNDHTAVWDWLKFLRARNEEDLTMIAQVSPTMNKVVGVLMELSADEQPRLIYEEREKARRGL